MTGGGGYSASQSTSTAATSGAQITANTGGVSYKSKKDDPPWLVITLAGIAALLCGIYLIRR